MTETTRGAGKSAARTTSAAAKTDRSAGRAVRPQTVATPWGRAALVERLAVPQRAGEKRFASVLELLELPAGEGLVRIAYSTDGRARRGPVTLRLRDLVRLREAVRRSPALVEILGGEEA